MSRLTPADADGLAELAPLARRAVSLDPSSLIRIRLAPESATALVRLPFGVLVGRTVGGAFGANRDGVYRSDELLAWLDGSPGAQVPAERDTDWRVGLPPQVGWQRVETVADDVIRGLVRAGASTLKEAAEREGQPNAQPRAEVADVLLDSIVLTAEQGERRAEVSLRLLSALVRMGFLARDSHLGIDVAGRWLRLAASYGSAYAEAPGQGLGITVRR
jgi:hypothetical protein